MKQATGLLVCVLCLVPAIAPACGGDANADAAGHGDKRTFEGEYQWSSGGDNRLTAEFTPDGEDSWRVEFRFRFNGRSHTWNGTAQGRLEDGASLTGTAESDGGGRTWEFEATLADGVLSGRHAETTGGRRVSTGTFKLRR